MAKLSTRTKLLLKRRIWVRKIFQERKNKDEFHRLINELCVHDHENTSSSISVFTIKI